MSEERYRKLGTEKQVVFDKHFDILYEKYKLMAKEAGFSGDLKFVREHGRVIVYTVI